MLYMCHWTKAFQIVLWGGSCHYLQVIKKSWDRGEGKNPRDVGATHSAPPERGTLSLPRPMPPCPSGWGVCECVSSVMSNSLGSMDHGPPGSSVHGIFQVRILEWIAIIFSRRSSQRRDPTHISCASCIAGGFFTAAPPAKPWGPLKRRQCVRTEWACLWENELPVPGGIQSEAGRPGSGI